MYCSRAFLDRYLLVKYTQCSLLIVSLIMYFLNLIIFVEKKYLEKTICLWSKFEVRFFLLSFNCALCEMFNSTLKADWLKLNWTC